MPTPAECQSIFLTGFMGSGKTTLGKLAAAQLGLLFFDLDEEIVCRAHRSIAELFTDGELCFREHEHHILLQLLAETSNQPCLIALGGGTSTHPSNQLLIPPERQIYLDVPFQLLEQRLAACTHRPLARNRGELKRLHDERLPLYSRAKTTLALSPDDDLNRAAQKLTACLRELLYEEQG